MSTTPLGVALEFNPELIGWFPLPSHAAARRPGPSRRGYVLRNEADVRRYVAAVQGGGSPIATGRIIDADELLATSYATGLRNGRVEDPELQRARQESPSLSHHYDDLVEQMVDMGVLESSFSEGGHPALGLTELGRLFEDETLVLFFSPAVKSALAKRPLQVQLVTRARRWGRCRTGSAENNPLTEMPAIAMRGRRKERTMASTTKKQDTDEATDFASQIAAGLRRFCDTVNDIGTAEVRQRDDAFETAQSSLTALSRTFEDALREHETAAREAAGTEGAREADDALIEARMWIRHDSSKKSRGGASGARVSSQGGRGGERPSDRGRLGGPRRRPGPGVADGFGNGVHASRCPRDQVAAAERRVRRLRVQ